MTGRAGAAASTPIAGTPIANTPIAGTPIAGTLIVGANLRPVATLATDADAILIRHERIAAVGRGDDLTRAAAGATRIDVRGATILPGFIDSHAHLENGDNYDHSMDGATSPGEVLDRLRRVLVESDAEVVECHGLGPCELPTIAELDAVAADRPVVIGIGAGSMVANTAALRLSQRRHGNRYVDRQVTEGAQGTGRFRGRDVKDFLRSLTGYDEAYVERALLRGATELRRAGITSVHHVVRDPLPVRVWQRLRAEGRLPLRVGLLLRGYESKIPLDGIVQTGIRQGFGDPWLRVQGVKISVDAHFPGGGAAFTEPYADEPGNSGSLRADQDQLNAFIRAAHGARLRCCVHANGDRAIDMALDAFAAAFAADPWPGHRHRMEHAGNIYLRDDQITRMRDLGVVAVPNPPFLRARAQHVARRLGADRARRPMRLRDLLDAGVPVLAASDFPGLWPADPLLCMQALVTREDATGERFAPDQALTVAEAVELYTSRAAWGAYEEADKGTIEAGKLADLVVLDADPYAVDPGEIGSIPVRATLIGGTVLEGSLEGTA